MLVQEGIALGAGIYPRDACAAFKGLGLHHCNSCFYERP